MGRGTTVNPLFGSRRQPRHTARHEEAKLSVELVHSLTLLRNIISAQEKPLTPEGAQTFIADLLEGKVKESSKITQAALAYSTINRKVSALYGKQFEQATLIEQQQAVVDVIRDHQLRKSNPDER